MNASTIRIACVQTDPRLGQVEINLVRLCAWVERAAQAKAKLVVFPECALSGYVFESLEEARPHAEEIPGPATARIVRCCLDHKIHVVWGMLERAGNQLHNACVLAGPEGILSVYRKVHLPAMGVDRFTTAGTNEFTVCEAAGIRLGLHICYDGAFPEPPRALALSGAELLVLPTNWATGAEPLAEHLMACRALENVVYAMAVDRVGDEAGTRFIGGSGIYDPFGRTLAKAGDREEEMLVTEIDPARARDKLIVRQPGRAWCDRFADRRPEHYRTLVP